MSGVKEIMDEYKKIQEQKKKPEVNLAIIRIRGTVGALSTIKSTLKMLRIERNNYCAVYKSTPSILGMIKKAKDYITWGEVDDATLKILHDKKGEKDPKDPKLLKKFFRLAPPRGGYERKGIKTPFKSGGAAGNRGKKINDLIKRMI